MAGEDVVKLVSGVCPLLENLSNLCDDWTLMTGNASLPLAGPAGLG